MIKGYILKGWKVTPTLPYTKRPVHMAWNTGVSALTEDSLIEPDMGVAILHAFSGTCSLDIEDLEETKWIFLFEFGILLQSIIDSNDAVIIRHADKNKMKLLFKLNNGPRQTKKYIKDGKCIFEFRCASGGDKSDADMLPPSIHPNGSRYEWSGSGDWGDPPTIPEALLDVWVNIFKRTEDSSDAGTDLEFTTDVNELIDAIDHIDPSCCYDEWIRIGMALHWWGEKEKEDTFDIWDSWSTKSDKYPGKSEMKSKWASFSNPIRPVRIGTFFSIAFQNGWVRRFDAEVLFKNIEPAPYMSVENAFRPTPPEANFDNVPRILATRSFEISEAMGCDPLIPLFSGLATISGVADARSRLVIFDGDDPFIVPPILWVMVIGKSSDKKTAAAKPLMKVIGEIEMEDEPRFGKEFLLWRAEEAQHNTLEQSFLKFATTPEGILSMENAPDVPKLRPSPVPLRVTVSDVTSQSLTKLLASRPRGMLAFFDEMHGWLKKLNDPRSMDDRSAWVVSYNAETYQVDRVLSGSTFIKNFALSIYGNVQPEVFRKYVNLMSSDGLLQRFLPVPLNPGKSVTGKLTQKGTSHKKEWDKLVRLISKVPDMEYRLSKESIDLFRDFEYWLDDRKKNETLIGSNDAYIDTLGRIRGVAGRLILIFHLMDEPFFDEVPAKTTNSAINFVKQYVIPALRFTFTEFLEFERFDAYVMEWVVRREECEFTMSQIRMAMRRNTSTLPQQRIDSAIDMVLDYLESMGWVKCTSSLRGKKMGRNDWTINPKLHEVFKEYREQLIKARKAIANDAVTKTPDWRPFKKLRKRAEPNC